MADEVTINASLSYEDSENTSDAISLVDVIKSVATKKITHLKQSIGTSEEAIDLGDVSAPGYAIFINRHATATIDLKVATSGAIFARLDPDTDSDGKGGFALLKLGSGAQVPYAIASAEAPMEIFIIAT
jgi:hypothetical protein